MLVTVTVGLSLVLLAGAGVRALLFTRGVGAPVSHITTPILDNFNRPDEDPLDPTHWAFLDPSTIPHDGGAYYFHIVNEQINKDITGGGNTGMEYWRASFPGDQEAYYTASSVTTTPEYWVVLNYSYSDNSGYVMKAYQGTWTIYRLDAGVETVLAQVSQPDVQAGDILIGRHEGTRLSFSYQRNGVETEVVTANDSTYNGQHIGLMTHGNDYADDFGGGSLHGSGLQLGNLEKGLVGHWKLDGNAKNATPYNINCSRGGGSSDVADRKGQAASSISWTGAGHGSINCGQPSALQFPGGSVSISAWVKPSDFIDSTGGIAGSISGYYLATDASGLAMFHLQVSGSQSTVVTSTMPLSVNTWYLLTGTYDGSTAKLYINGQLDTSVPETRALANFSNDFTIASLSSSTRNFDGAIDDVRVYNRALSPAEVSKLYHSYDANLSLGGSGSISLGKGLVGRWPMNGNTKDATPYADDCTIPFGGVSLTTDREGQSNSAYSFTTRHYMQCPLNDVLKPANYVSVSAWINPGVQSNTINGIGGDAFNDGYGLYLDGSGTPYFQVGGISLAGSSSLSTGQWYLVAGTYDGATIRIYVNGNLASSQAHTGNLSTISTLFNIGTLIQSSTRSFIGSIDDVRVYNRALSPAEVQALYNTYD